MSDTTVVKNESFWHIQKHKSSNPYLGGGGRFWGSENFIFLLAFRDRFSFPYIPHKHMELVQQKNIYFPVGGHLGMKIFFFTDLGKIKKKINTPPEYQMAGALSEKYL